MDPKSTPTQSLAAPTSFGLWPHPGHSEPGNLLQNLLSLATCPWPVTLPPLPAEAQDRLLQGPAPPAPRAAMAPRDRYLVLPQTSRGPGGLELTATPVPLTKPQCPKTEEGRLGRLAQVHRGRHRDRTLNSGTLVQCSSSGVLHVQQGQLLHANSTRLTVAIASLSPKTTRMELPGGHRHHPRMHRTPRWQLEPYSLSTLLLQRDPGSWPQAPEPPRQCVQTATTPECQSRAGRHPEDTLPQGATSTCPSTQCSHGDHRSPSHSPPGGATACTHRAADHEPGSSDRSRGGLLENVHALKVSLSHAGPQRLLGSAGPGHSSPVQSPPLPGSLPLSSLTRSRDRLSLPEMGALRPGTSIILTCPSLLFPLLLLPSPPFSSIAVATTCNI